MNKIVLVRHGEPALFIERRISGSEILSFLQKYNDAPLKSDSLPSSRLLYLAQNATVICSNLKRSTASAKKCGVQPHISDVLFAESIPPHFQNGMFRLYPRQWLLLSRVMWMVGFSLNGESFLRVKKRAQKAADMLISEAARKDVVLFGHGLFNIMIAAQLRKKGFYGPKVPARNFWEYGVYRR